MNSHLANQVVCDVLHQIQSGQGLPCPPLKKTTRPIKDLEKFDSPMSIAATGMIGRRLGIKIPPQTNLFGDKGGFHPIQKTVGILCEIAATKRAAQPASAAE